MEKLRVVRTTAVVGKKSRIIVNHFDDLMRYFKIRVWIQENKFAISQARFTHTCVNTGNKPTESANYMRMLACIPIDVIVCISVKIIYFYFSMVYFKSYLSHRVAYAGIHACPEILNIRRTGCVDFVTILWRAYCKPIDWFVYQPFCTLFKTGKYVFYCYNFLEILIIYW